MKTSSAKAKGRRLQQEVVTAILEAFPQLQRDDVTSRSMGCQGEDILLSPKARALFPFTVECKNQEANKKIYDWYEQCSHISDISSFIDKKIPVVVMSKNRQEPLAVLSLKDLLSLISYLPRS